MDKRDLAADLSLCNAATPGPWHSAVIGTPRISVWYKVMGGETLKDVSERIDSREDAQFIAAARQGWPDAIEQAMAAESEVERLTLISDDARLMYAELKAAERRAIRANESLLSVLRCLSWEAEDWEAYKRYRAEETAIS
jgi:hypothetical protein